MDVKTIVAIGSLVVFIIGALIFLKIRSLKDDRGRPMQPLTYPKKYKEDSTMVHYFHSDIAQKYGINAAKACGVAFGYCIEGQEHTGQPQLHEGQGLARCSVQMLTGFFPYLPMTKSVMR